MYKLHAINQTSYFRTVLSHNSSNRTFNDFNTNRQQGRMNKIKLFYHNHVH